MGRQVNSLRATRGELFGAGGVFIGYPVDFMEPLYFLRTKAVVLVFADDYETDGGVMAAAHWARVWSGLPVVVIERRPRVPFRVSSASVSDS